MVLKSIRIQTTKRNFWPASVYYGLAVNCRKVVINVRMEHKIQKIFVQDCSTITVNYKTIIARTRLFQGISNTMLYWFNNTFNIIYYYIIKLLVCTFVLLTYCIKVFHTYELWRPLCTCWFSMNKYKVITFV